MNNQTQSIPRPKIDYHEHLAKLKALYRLASCNPQICGEPSWNSYPEIFSDFQEYHELMSELEREGILRVHDQIWNPKNPRTIGYRETRVDLKKFKGYITRLTPTTDRYSEKTTLDDFNK
jgi:hypothetical protein